MDILVPAALENQIDGRIAKLISVALIVEGANGPTTSWADHILLDRRITVAPDVLANAGGVFGWCDCLLFRVGAGYLIIFLEHR